MTNTFYTARFNRFGTRSKRSFQEKGKTFDGAGLLHISLNTSSSIPLKPISKGRASSNAMYAALTVKTSPYATSTHPPPTL